MPSSMISTAYHNTIPAGKLVLILHGKKGVGGFEFFFASIILLESTTISASVFQFFFSGEHNVPTPTLLLYNYTAFLYAMFDILPARKRYYIYLKISTFFKTYLFE